MTRAGKRIGLIAETHGEGVDPAVRDAVEGCAAHLSSLGATVEEVRLSLWLAESLTLWRSVC